MQKEHGIAYRIRCIVSDKCYIGVTRYTSLKRWARHVYETRYTTTRGCKVLNSAILKYGPEAFVVEDVAYALGSDDLLHLETLLIRQEKTVAPFGYNLNEGGRGNLNPSLETRKRISESLSGKRFSKERKQRMSESRLGIKLGPMKENTKNKIGNANRGKTRSAKVCQMMSEQRQGKKTKPHSESTKQKITDALIGVPHSEERVRNMVASKRANPNYGITVRHRMHCRGQKNFRVRIGISGKTTHIGDYDTYDEAIAARDTALLAPG